MSWYRLHRGWMDNPVFRNEPLSRHAAFAWLVENANYKPAKVYAPKGEISLDRGQLCHSLRFMANAWKWDEAKVRRFLSSLQTAKIIDAATDAGQTVVTICNYAKYQDAIGDGDAATDASSTQQRRGGDAKKKEGKEEREYNTPLPPKGDVVFPMPDGVDPDCWRDFLANRKKKKMPNTATAHKRLLSDLAKHQTKYWTAGKLIEHAASHGWAGIYDPGQPQRRSNGHDADMPIC